jgi:hypothetical protein
MKKTSVILGCAAMLGAVSATDALAAQSRWMGDLVITAKSGSCPDFDPVGDRYVVRFQPGGVGTNGASTFLNLHGRNWVMGYKKAAGRFNTAFQPVQTTMIGASIGTATSYIRFATQAPAAIAATTRFITVTGQIKGYDYMPACVVTFSTVLQPGS